MRGEDELKELREREARAIQAIQKLKDEILPILAEDLVKFPEREVRKRFVSSPEFAESLDDATLARLKAEVNRRAEAMRDRVIALLAEDARWLAGTEASGPGKSLAENPRLWEATSAAADLVREILTAYGFPQVAECEYRMPTWFISGKYLPGLAEKYWALVAEIREIRARMREVEEGLVRTNLGRRWDRIRGEAKSDE